MHVVDENQTAHTISELAQPSIPPEDASGFYRGVFWAAADAILVADETGRYLDANQAAATLLGYAPEELLGMRVADVVAPGPDWAASEYEQYVREGTWSGELELRRQDGTLIPVEAHATVVPRQDGRPLYLSMIRDVSARRAAERAQQEFLTMVTHELKTPLTVIQGNVQLMQHRQAYDASSVDAIVSQTKRIHRIIDDLRDAAYLATAQVELRRSSVDLVALVREMAAQAMTATPTHPVQVETPAMPLVGWWDADRLAQVLHNLLVNASKYSPAQRTTLIRVESCADEARVSVVDQGLGIAPDELPHLFERFYRTNSAARSGAGGLGLGLHICKVLVEAHGGHIWIQSVLGQGTTAYFTLPYNQASSS